MHCHPKPPPPPRPLPPQGYLLQKIIACEHVSVPSLCVEWSPECGDAANVQCVSASGAACASCAAGVLEASLPLTVTYRDACGRLRTSCASVSAQAPLPHTCLCDDPRSSLLVLPCVRLMSAQPAGCGAFRLHLQAQLQVYALRYEVCGTPRPACPQLPLYPPPHC